MRSNLKVLSCLSKWYSYLDGLEENMEPSTIQELQDYFLTIHKHQLSVIEKIAIH